MSPARSPWRNAGPGTAQADFFILLSDMPGLDAGGPGGDADGFAAFGHVIEGMDVVKKICDAPVSPTKGEGAMKGQMLDPPVKIIKAERREVAAIELDDPEPLLGVVQSIVSKRGSSRSESRSGSASAMRT